MSLRLSPQHERELLASAKDGDATARSQLVEDSLPLIGSVARNYRRSPGISRAELMQDGVVGLLRAADRYDDSLGTPFWAYASWWVRQAMQQLVSERTRPVRLSDRAQRQLARLRAAQQEHLTAENREPSTAELSSATGLPRERVERLIAIERTPRALEEPAGDEDDPQTFADLLADPRAEDEYEQADRRMDIQRLRRLPCELCDRERAILCAHYGLGRPAKTLREIGTDLGISAERVRQVEEGALEKLRDALTERSPAAAGV